MSLPVSTAIKQKIRALVNDGVHSVSEMKRHLKHYVRSELCVKNSAEMSNRRYFPSNSTIRNYIYRARMAKLQSKIDHVNLTQKISEWRKQYPDDKLYFRDYVDSIATDVDDEEQSLSGVDNGEKSDDDDDENDDVYLDANIASMSTKAGLLFCYQSNWQKKLMIKYGQDICLLDATYKTTKYAMPLFFICVKTNVNYIVVASFVMQTEDTRSISEALTIIRDWNPDWQPSNWMVDFSEMEINALNATFPG